MSAQYIKIIFVLKPTIVLTENKFLLEREYMNIAVIIVGGVGHRMGQDIPKQFINVYDKPILIYTLEGFHKFIGNKSAKIKSIIERKEHHK